MFQKILIANRGEIAVRVTRTLQQMGITAATVYADADRRSVHVRSADEAYHLEGQTVGETYLNIEKIIDAARMHGVDAVHPGYGFLAENAAFARSCRDAGLVFIGPEPEVIEAMGDKVAAKQAAVAAGVPVVPGWSGSTADVREVRAQARKIGYPLLVKATAGGGGKGMRVVGEERELAQALEAAQREAAAAFGDGRIFLEKYLASPRHVEVQIFGDRRGRVVHLFERDCSVQRRYQKIIEESPAPGLSAGLRERLTAAAVDLATAIGYHNAGTVEFLVDEHDAFYFLEVNTRLQVEHPVTELVLRQDLVRAQVLVAADQPLPFEQQDLDPQGHALECRVYAEDPAAGFLPSTGTVAHFAPPNGPGVRVDSGIQRGSEVTVNYDPMLAKVVVWERTRDQALQLMARSLRDFVVLGVRTNLEFLQQVVLDPRFAAGAVHTHYLEEGKPAARLTDHSRPALIIAALASRTAAGVSPGQAGAAPASGGPWTHAGPWRMLQ